MIVDRRIGDILAGPEEHVAFAISDGYNQAGVAGMIAYTCWPELAKEGPYRLNTVLTHETTRHETTRRIFHALVVHSMDRRRWEETPNRIGSCLMKIQVPSDKEIAMVAIGTSEFDQSRGANPEANMHAMERSPKKIVLYSLE